MQGTSGATWRARQPAPGPRTHFRGPWNLRQSLRRNTCGQLELRYLCNESPGQDPNSISRTDLPIESPVHVVTNDNGRAALPFQVNRMSDRRGVSVLES